MKVAVGYIQSGRTEHRRVLHLPWVYAERKTVVVFNLIAATQLRCFDLTAAADDDRLHR